MSTNPLNDISKVYLDQISEKKKDDSYLEPDMKKRQSNNEKARKELTKGPQMKNPHFEEKRTESDIANSLVDAYKAVYQTMSKEEVEKLDEISQKTATKAFAKRATDEFETDSDSKKSDATKRRIEKKFGKKAGQHAERAAHATTFGRKSFSMPKVDEEYVDEAMSSYDRNRKRAAQRAADRNAARAAGKTGVVPGVGYVTPRREKETYTDEKGTVRHKSGAKNEELELDENRRAARAAGGYKDDSKKQNDPSKAGFTGIGNMSIDQIRKMSARMDKEKTQKEGLDPVGKEDGDVNNDGKKDGTDKYLMNRRKAIGNAMKKKLKESRSLSEVMSDTESEIIVKEKKVNNKIKINPKLGEAVEEMGGFLIDHIEIDEMDFIIESVYDELLEEGYAEDDVEEAIENAMEATVTFGSDTKPMKKDGSQVGSRRKFLKRKAGEFLQKSKKKVGMAVAQARVDAYNKKREVKQAAKDKVNQKKQGLKNFIKNKAQKVVDRMSEEVENVDEIYKGKHGQTETQYQDSRSDAGKMISGDSKMSGSRYAQGRRTSSDAGPQPAGGSKKPASQGKMDSGTRTDITFRKAALKKKAAEMKEDAEVSEGVYGDKTSMRKAAAKERASEKKAGSKAKAPGRLGPSAGKSYADHEEYSIRAHDKITKKTKPSVVGMTSEEASMSPQELQLQKKKAMVDRMIAMKRAQDLSKKKTGAETPVKAMGEATEDSLRDRRMERGGVDGNVRYDRAPKPANTAGKKKPASDGMSAFEKVKASIRAKHGQGAIMDTEKK